MNNRSPGNWIIVLATLFTYRVNSEEGEKPTRDFFREIRESDQSNMCQIFRELKRGDIAFYGDIKQIFELSQTKQLGCAEVLCHRGNSAGYDILLKVLNSSGDVPNKIDALRILANYGLHRKLPKRASIQDQVISYLRSSIRNSKNTRLRIALASALWRCAIEEDDRIAAVESLNKAALSDVFEEKIEAAFAVAELNSFTVLPSRAIGILELIENEPSVEGIRAKQVLEKHRLTQSLIADDRYYGRVGQPLLDEMIRKVGQYYVDEKFTNPAYLIESGARGIAAGLDRFSSYLGVKQWGDFKAGMSGTYAGIGAVLRQQGDSVIIDRVFYTGPAYKAGIRSYDEIISIIEDGKDAGGDSKSILDKVRGKPGTKVTLRVRRYSSPNELEIEVLREIIRIPSVYTRRLPGGIGYIRLSSFGNDSDSEFRNKLDELEQEAPISGLIMDLRNNPGGLINAAQGIASLFLDDDKLIVYSEGRNAEVAPRREYRVQRDVESEDTDSQRKNAKRDYPLVVLINGQSASASEIVSGALQDHKRAKLVGERTYGKGSVQQVMPLDSTKGTSALKLTVAKYYLPSGRSIHEVGLQADIERQDQTGPKEKYDREKTWSQKPFVKYVFQNMDKHMELFEKLAWTDNREEKNYPLFESFYSSLQSKAPKQYVRYKLRQYLRRILSDRKGKEYIVDIVEDEVLKKGIETICRMSGIKIQDIPGYSLLLREGEND